MMYPSFLAYTRATSTDKQSNRRAHLSQARKYILDPLRAPEPSQETGPGTSHYIQRHTSVPRATSSSPSSSRPTVHLVERRKQAIDSLAHATSGYPSPPSSASPNRVNFPPSNPYSPSRKTVSVSRSHTEEPSPPTSPPGNAAPRSALPTHTNTSRRYPPITKLGRRSSARPADPRPSHPEISHQRSYSDTSHDLHHRNRLRERFPGDMSHRPLDIIKKETRAANRSHKPRNVPDTDIIDKLDTIGGTYHHGGPYDATLASRNMNKKYSPVAAVQDSNEEAIRATPRAYVKDSLDRHMPLQGIASIPPGETDMAGSTMRYQEGTDLMRDPDAPGGAYRRWDGLDYHPDDIKGKSEPSYTIEKAEKDKKHSAFKEEYEMQSGVNGDGFLGPAPRLRSNSGAASTGNAYQYDSSSVRRSHSTGGKRLSDGLKRRIGSIRRKRDVPAGEVH
ncbi:hypothetical protein S7711_02626 [Stachybotrys chartarum IBT 7711]|uniref:Pal1 cell morphology protein n=1 Tax=Stachybotrys chartarum (strain CBS 109288 / IBT 7711) TaxID=1280523 RepID=A0A084B907_STACB|nr:hypothetical protein S7711_02626 [Stachybotrys chartarum IBT 7711]KFA56214.1 hypothetical protein S40293_00243 [Stachybotrys chartarum IBT 40293]